MAAVLAEQETAELGDELLRSVRSTSRVVAPRGFRYGWRRGKCMAALCRGTRRLLSFRGASLRDSRRVCGAGVAISWCTAARAAAPKRGLETEECSLSVPAGVRGLVAR